MSSATERRSMELAAYARPWSWMTDRPGAPPSRAHLPGEPSGGVGQRDDELGRRAAGKEPFDGTHDTDRSDRVPAMVEDRGGDLALADDRLMRFGGEPGRRNVLQGKRQGVRVDDGPSGEPLERARYQRSAAVRGQERGMDLPERGRMPGNGRPDLEDLYGIVRAEHVMDHQHAAPVEHPHTHGLADPLRQRVRPNERPSPQLVMVQERIAELEQLRAEPVLPRLRILLHEVLPLQGTQQPVNGRLGEAEALGELADPEPGRARGQRFQDPCRPIDRL